MWMQASIPDLIASYSIQPDDSNFPGSWALQLSHSFQRQYISVLYLSVVI